MRFRRSDEAEDARRMAREEAILALQRWLNAEARPGRGKWEPARRIGPWPYLAVVAGAGIAGLPFCESPPGPDWLMVTSVVGGVVFASAAIGTIIERVRERARVVSGMARVAAFAAARTAATPELPLAPAVERALPAVIAGPLQRARGACAGIARIAADPAWTQAQVPVKEHEVHARAQLRALEERSRRLAMVDGLLASADGLGEGSGHLQQLAAVYQRHCEALVLAAEMFERAQASLARALLSLADGAPGATAPAAELRDIGVAFESLSEVLESLARGPEVGESQALTPGPGSYTHLTLPTN